MILYRIYTTVVIEHDLTADGPDEAMEAAWAWSQTLPANHEVLSHSVNHRHEVSP